MFEVWDFVYWYLKYSDHVCTELIKLNGIDFKSQDLTIEEALVNPKITEPSPSGNKTTEIKNYQTSIEEVPAVPSKRSKSNKIA